MKKLVSLAIIIALACAGAVFAQQAPALPEIATPPGGTLITEINLSDADLLGMIKQAIPAFAQSAAGAPGELGKGLSSLDLNSLSEAISGIKQIRVLRFKFAPGTDLNKVAGFYQAELTPEQGWSRIFFDASSTLPTGGAVSVYSRSGQDFFLVASESKDNTVVAARTIGFIDVPKLASWAGRMAKFAAEQQVKQQSKPKASVKAAPAKPVKKAPAKGTRR